MQYYYTKTGYHPRQVSFEVGAMLLDEEKAREAGQALLQPIIPGNYSGYKSEQGLGFNELTAHNVKFKHHKKERGTWYLHNKNVTKKAKENNLSIQNSGRHQLMEILDSFAVVIQNMLVKYVMALKSIRKTKRVHISFLNVMQVEHALRHKEAASIKYTLHPHVDALIKERQNERNKNITINK